MSRDFLLVLGGGVVSLVTTLVVLFVTDWVYRHDLAHAHQTDSSRAASPAGGKEQAST